MIRKTLAYFFITLILGSIVFGFSAIVLAGRPEWESIPLTAWTMIGIFTISLLVCLPLLIPILIFYAILHFAKPSPKLYYILRTGAIFRLGIHAQYFLSSRGYAF